MERKKKKIRRGQKIKNKLKNFRVLSHNIRGIKSKLPSLLTIIAEDDPTIFCITETHLLEEEKIDVEGYEIYRNDRDNLGGGVLIGVKLELNKITTIVEKSSEVGEILWIVIDNQRIKLRIGIVYAPQESRTSKERLQVMYDKIDKQNACKSKGTEIVDLGRFQL